MKRLLTLAAAALAVPASAAQITSSVTANFLVSPVAPPPSGLLIIKRNREILLLTAQAPLAARLEGAVSEADLSAGKASKHYPLTAGQILAGLHARSGTYCTPLTTSGFGEAGPCLIDEDGDGRFEHIAPGGYNSGGDQLLVNRKAEIVGARIGKPRLLAAPVTYSRAEASAAPRANVRLRWTSDYKRDATTSPVNLAFWLEGGPKFADPLVVSARVLAQYEGEPVEVVVHGVHLRLLGFETDGALRAELVASAPQTVMFEAFETPMPLIIYVPR